MRKFFLRNQELTSCGIAEKPGGWKFFCATCGETWGAIHGMESNWFCATFPCEKHGNKYRPGGSFIPALVWWDQRNGSSMEKQLDSFNETLLRHEALMAAEWILRNKQ